MISTGPSVMRLARFVNGNAYKPGDFGESGFPVVRIKHLLDESAELDLAAGSPRAVWLEDGDLVFSWSATLAVRFWKRGKALLNQHLFRVDVHPGIDRRWFAYVLEEGIRRLEPLMHGSAMTHITHDMLRSLTVTQPAIAAQRAIADHLDRETTRIDALIAAKRRMVDLLDERWQTVMHDAAAGRLRATSGVRRRTFVPWLTDVPDHWREGHLKLLARLGTGHTPSRSHPEWWIDPTIPWITTGEVAQMRADRVEYITETRERISELGMSNSSATLHPSGTVVLCRTASAGYSAIMGRDMATSQDFATWTCGPLLRPRFLLLCLRAMRQDLLGRLAMGSTHMTIYMPDIEAVKIPIPPTNEQDAIVVEAYSQQQALDACSRNLDDHITLLQERRQALITAAVTGQLDITEAA